MTASSSHRDAPPGPGTVGPYRLQAPLGEGGMGVVHLAQAPDGRRVALKVLRPHVVGDAEARARLAREVETLRRVSSPRVAEILDADPEGPVPYVVTRYVPGLSLYHHVAEEGVLTGRDLRHAMTCLAQALVAVHAVGVLHRDIKPTNVLMEGRAPVLIDFGLAKLADDGRLTQTGFLMGTPGYLAPEILYGDDPTPASDVHAWAATIAFAATGRPPYGTGPTLAVMDRVRLGQHDLGDVPEPERGLLAACLAPEPGDRPTLAEVLDWLARHGDGSATATPVAGRATAEPPLTMPFLAAASAAPAAPAPTSAAPAPVDDATTRTATFHPTGPRDEPPPPAFRSQPGPTEVIAGPRRDPAPAASPPWIAPAEGADRWAPSRAQRWAQLVALGLLAGAVVAVAPYAGLVLVTVAVLLLRTVSLTRQRHQRRQRLRGRSTWYDVPASWLASPVYALGALGGSLAVVGVAALVALAMFSVGFLLARPVPVSLLLAGAGFVPALWWGPGAARMRDSVHDLVDRPARTDLGGWLVAALALGLAAVLVSVLLGPGPTWAPASGPPW